MRSSRPALRLLLCACLAHSSWAHGGMYAGPPGGAGPFSGGAGGGAGFGPGATATMPTTAPQDTLSDPAQWQYWWRHNRSPYLALKLHVRANGVSSGADGVFLSDGLGPQLSLAPSEAQVRGQIVPALFAALEQESDNDLVTGILVALAKIGSDGSAADAARFEAVMKRRLRDPSQEIRETAAVALGILASPSALPTLAHLLWDTQEGRALVGEGEVNYRTRAFAAYGLGLAGARAASEIDRQQIVAILRHALESDETRTRDVEVACVIALGLVPLATLELPVAAVAAPRREQPPESARVSQLDYLLAILRDEEHSNTVRAHCPAALTRLLVGLPEPLHAQYREAIAGECLARIEADDDANEIVESCVQALGALGTSDAGALDVRLRRVLAAIPKDLADAQARAFALIASAEAGAQLGADPTGPGLAPARDFLLEQLASGKNALQPWAALAAGVLARRLSNADPHHPALGALQLHLRVALEGERAHERVAACALGAGLARADECAPQLLKLLDKELQDDARGSVALALALLDHREAIAPLRALVARSKYRPELLLQSAMALAILGDKQLPAQLAGMLAEAHSLAAQSALASALGYTGDQRSVAPLLQLLNSRLVTAKARAFAAVALGNVADKELLPWNAKIGLDLNYRAAPATLTDPNGAGILDLF